MKPWISCLNFWDEAWWFLSLRDFRTIVFIFIVISTFWPICPPAFFRCLLNSGTFTELLTTSFIESGHNWVQALSIPVLLLVCSQDWTCNLQMIVSLEATPITVMPCVLLDNSEWIFGTYKLIVLTWLELLLLCMIFLPVLIFRFFFFMIKMKPHSLFLSIGQSESSNPILPHCINRYNSLVKHTVML